MTGPAKGAARSRSARECGVHTVARLLARAIRLRCPHCGAAHIRRRWLTFLPACHACGLRLERGEEDHWLGAYLINFIVIELLIVIAMTVVILRTWPSVRWEIVVYGALIPAVPGPILTYPFAKNVWLAIDLLMRPPEPADFAPACNDG